MRDERHELVIPCPRCGAGISWALRDYGDERAVEVRHAGCACQLTRDQWADLAERANTLLDEPQEAHR